MSAVLQTKKKSFLFVIDIKPSDLKHHFEPFVVTYTQKFTRVLIFTFECDA